MSENRKIHIYWLPLWKIPYSVYVVHYYNFSHRQCTLYLCSLPTAVKMHNTKYQICVYNWIRIFMWMSAIFPYLLLLSIWIFCNLLHAFFANFCAAVFFFFFTLSAINKFVICDVFLLSFQFFELQQTMTNHLHLNRMNNSFSLMYLCCDEWIYRFVFYSVGQFQTQKNPTKEQIFIYSCSSSCHT